MKALLYCLSAALALLLGGCSMFQREKAPPPYSYESVTKQVKGWDGT